MISLYPNLFGFSFHVGAELAPTAFYPVLNEEYATQIARDWNARDGNSGYVTRFQVNANFLQRYEVHQVGSVIHQEYWIPAEELEDFDRNIVGNIEVIAEFHSH